MKTEDIFDVIIAGGGPAGSACALCLADSGLKIALVDKVTFPRNKICGDALSPDVIKQLPKISKNLHNKLNGYKNKVSTGGLRLFGPAGEPLEMLINNSDEHPGYVMRRIHFDNLLHDCVKEIPSVKFFGNTKVESVKNYNDHISLKTSSGELNGKILVGADGANSVTARFVKDHKKSKKHLCIGIKCYYKNVSDLHKGNYIELHFYRNLLPCYLWIFPMHNNETNVGLALMYDDLKKSKLSLKEIMLDIIAQHPVVAPRFRSAERITPVEAWPLPLAMKKHILSDERILLAGDAAGLVDPFTGEGVGNALRSGRIAAEHILKCVAENNFSEKFNKAYDREIYKRMWNEFRINKMIQKVLHYPKVIDYVIKRANNSEEAKKVLTKAIDSNEVKEKMIKYYLLNKLKLK